MCGEGWGIVFGGKGLLTLPSNLYLLILNAKNVVKQALCAIVFSLRFAFEVKIKMLRTQITYFNPI